MSREAVLPRTVDASRSSAPASSYRQAEHLSFTKGQQLAKRSLDICLAILQLALSAPVWIVIPLAIKLEDGGPVFFGQSRPGKGGKPFTSWKFRTMRHDPEASHSVQARQDDPRITRVGRILRKTALDELPQLWNILRGDMSFVGPRALPVEEAPVHADGRKVERLRDVPGYAERHLVRPGLTGLAQLYLARDVPTRHKFRYDCLYIRRRSLCLDVKLIVLSYWISLRGAWPKVGG